MAYFAVLVVVYSNSILKESRYGSKSWKYDDCTEWRSFNGN